MMVGIMVLNSWQFTSTLTPLEFIDFLITPKSFSSLKLRNKYQNLRALRGISHPTSGCKNGYEDRDDVMMMITMRMIALLFIFILFTFVLKIIITTIILFKKNLLFAH